MEYIREILFILSWPLLIYICYKFIILNINHFEKMEKLSQKDKKK